MHIPLLTTASISLLLAAAAATPLVTNPNTPAAEGTTFDSSTPPKPRLVAGLQGGGVAIAGAVAGAGAAGAACACCKCKKEQKRGDKQYRAGQDGRGGGAQRRRKMEDVEEDAERVELDERRGGEEDGFRHVQGDVQVIDMPESPPPSYAMLARPEGEGIELEAQPVGKGEVSKEV
ncbi:hypothetical protein VE03_02997 [Pseudogymnoascus sp. 23342-1-I1]|nr:hypothetical protein VE03_02997 [Pseudogymnoascus sp. 23342-1-I1]